MVRERGHGLPAFCTRVIALILDGSPLLDKGIEITQIIVPAPHRIKVDTIGHCHCTQAKATGGHRHSALPVIKRSRSQGEFIVDLRIFDNGRPQGDLITCPSCDIRRHLDRHRQI